MIPGERTRFIAERARALGFDLCGVVSLGDATGAAEILAELRHLPEWLARGYAGEMKYLHDPRRADPRRVLEGAQSLIVVALNYNSPQPRSTELEARRNGEPPRGWISRYAWGDDYHEIIQQNLHALIAEMHAQIPEPFAARAYADTGPILERVVAKYAGLGWLGKNTCLIHPRLGSWLFLGVIVTTLALEPTLHPEESPPPDLCGSCTRCLDACPTQAFSAPYLLDARRCISYLTIELRGAIPERVRPQMGGAVIGCDICQDVCPWNRKAPVSALAAFQPRSAEEARNSTFETRLSQTHPSALQASNAELGNSNAEFRFSLFAPQLEWLASLAPVEFSAVFRHSAVKRAKWRGLVRNACVALGNSALRPSDTTYARVVGLLERLAVSDDALIADHAGWALARLRAGDNPLTGSA